ncbi:MAG: hypothetical protein WBR26_06875 [Candidatus Acidiferrum sp.]
MSRPRNGGSRFKGLAATPGNENVKPAGYIVQPAFDGMIASACDLGISLEAFIEMTRSARMSDAAVVRFLDAWDALSPSEQQAKRTADAICERIGLAPVELLKATADATYRFSMYTARILAAVALPSVVERSIEVALTDKGIADRKMLFQHSGFLPTPAGSQTNIAVMQNAQPNATARPVITVAPRPEETIRRLSDRLNEARVKMNGGEEEDGKYSHMHR